MSTLADRRAHQVPHDRKHIRMDPAWRDFAAALFFSVVGIAATVAVLIAGIPLTGPDIFAG